MISYLLTVSFLASSLGNTPFLTDARILKWDLLESNGFKGPILL